MQITPLITQAEGITHFIDLLDNSEMFLRELVVNSTEAGATTIHVMPDWVHVADSAAAGEPIYRFMLLDNGCGMNREELRTFFRNMLNSGKELGKQGNFGVGGRASTLGISPQGVFVISCKDGEWSMIKMIKLDGRYGLLNFEYDDEGTLIKDDVIEPPEAYKDMGRENGIDQHGNHGNPRWRP